MYSKNKLNKTSFDSDFDQILRSSKSTAVQDKYRESFGGVNLGTSLRTTDRTDIWNNMDFSISSFPSKNVSVVSEDFKPAELMTSKLKKDEMDQEMEYAAVPQVNQKNNNDTAWDERGSIRQPEMSFGNYCQGYENNIRDVYGNKSPTKTRNRVPLVDLDNILSPTAPCTTPSDPNTDRLQQFISKFKFEFLRYLSTITELLKLF